MMKKNVLDDIELRSESVQEVLSNPPAWILRYGISIIFVIMLFTFIGTWFIKYPDIISAKAIITSENPPERLESKVNSRIAKIYVNNNKKVKKGDVIAILESTANYQDIITLSNVLDTLNTNYQNFFFPFNELKNLELGEVQSNYIQFQKTYIENELNQNLRPYSQEIFASQNSQNENSIRLNSLYAQQKLEFAKLNLSDHQLRRSQQLYDKGVISGYDLEVQKVNNLQARQSYDQTKLAISQQKEAINQTNKNIISGKISQKKLEVTNTSSLFQALDELKKSIHIWKLNYQLTANCDGVFKFQNSWKENQLIKTGDIFATILSENQHRFIGNLTVLSQNSGKIKYNQKVLIKLENFPNTEYGVLEGKIQTMSSVTDKEGNYFIEISLPNGLKTTYNKKIYFDKELSGQADIITDEMRLIERIFYQFKKLTLR